MTQPAERHLPPREIPSSFFESLPAPVAPRAINGASQAAPIKAMVLYDAIIDYMFAKPTCSMAEVAAHFRKSPTTISMLVRSDFFRVRWLQRREKFNEDLAFRLSSKITAVVEKSLDTTLEVLEKKGDSVPLAMLNDINKSLLDRLGYGPSPSGSAATAVQVNVQQNAGAGAPPSATQASPEAVARAREFLSLLEAGNAASGARPGNAAALEGSSLRFAGPVVEGEVVTENGDAPSA